MGDLKMLSALPQLLRNYSSHGSSSLLAVPSMNVVFGRKSSSDPYTKIREQPREVVESLAETLELRAAEEQQTLLRERVLAGTSGRVLEVGSGTGAVSRHLAKLPQIQSVLGVDPSPLLVERAQKLGGGPDYSVGCGTKLPLGEVAHPSPCCCNQLPRRALTQLCSGPHCSMCQRSNRLRCWLRSGGFLHLVVSW